MVGVLLTCPLSLLPFPFYASIEGKYPTVWASAVPLDASIFIESNVSLILLCHFRFWDILLHIVLI